MLSPKKVFFLLLSEKCQTFCLNNNLDQNITCSDFFKLEKHVIKMSDFCHTFFSVKKK